MLEDDKKCASAKVKLTHYRPDVAHTNVTHIYDKKPA